MNKDEFKVLREFSKNQKITQRKISEKLEISLGKVNNIIKTLQVDEYINMKGEKYSLTDKGKKELEKHKVNNAIIMAADYGARFDPMHAEIPKGLFEVFGETLIERQIKQLQSVGVEDITIVVGFLKEKLEYLVDDYNVKLIYSPDYSLKNNLATLYHVRHLLKNTYVISSDNYLTENLFNKYEYRSWYTAMKAEGTVAEWCIRTDRKNRIKQIEIGGKDMWYLYGPAYFSESFSEKIVPLLEETYKQLGSEDFYWENVLKRHIKELDIYAKKLKREVVYKFKTVDEIKKFDKSYKENEDRIKKAKVAKTFNVNEKDIKIINGEELGMTNDSFLFEYMQKKYIFRSPGKGTEQLISRDNEYRNYRAVVGLNITENISYMNPKTGIKISEYEEDSRVVDDTNKEEVKKCMEIIRTLHESNIEVPHKFNLEENILLYEQLCVKENAIMYKDFPVVRANMSELLSYLKKLDIEEKFAHIDPVYENFLVLNNGEIKLIDWEYAGMCDPLIDIAMFGIYSYYSQYQIDKLIEYYFKRKPTEEEKFRIYSYVALSGFLWSIWTQYKQALGDRFGDYGLKMYRYAKEYYKKSIEIARRL